MVKFGPFSYPHVVVFVVSRYLVGIVTQVLKSRQAEVQSLVGQFAVTRERVASTGRESLSSWTLLRSGRSTASRRGLRRSAWSCDLRPLSGSPPLPKSKPLRTHVLDMERPT